MSDSFYRFVVVHTAEDWRILHEGRRWGRFDHQGDAVEAAVRLAKDAKPGKIPCVMVLQRWGQLDTVRLDAPAEGVVSVRRSGNGLAGSSESGAGGLVERIASHRPKSRFPGQTKSPLSPKV